MNWLSDSINQISLVAAVLILLITIYVVGLYFKKMKDAKADGELEAHDWDGIKEFKNDVPIGWIISFMILIVWGLWYMFFGYPLNSFSQIGQYNDEIKAYNDHFEKQWAQLSDEDKIAMGEGIFLVQCSQCHGISAEGINGKAQNLRKWGTEEGVIETIKNGSKGLNYVSGEMPPGLVVDDKGAVDEKAIKQVAAYVMKTIAPAHESSASIEDLAAGSAIYDRVCATCHGMGGKGDGSGMENFASDLTKYGNYEHVKLVLQNGKKGFIGHMPSFSYANFNDVQIEALAAYINSLKSQN